MPARPRVRHRARGASACAPWCDAPEQLERSAPAGARVGSVTVYREGRRVRSVPLVTARRGSGGGPAAQGLEPDLWPDRGAGRRSGSRSWLIVRRRRRTLAARRRRRVRTSGPGDGAAGSDARVARRRPPCLYRYALAGSALPRHRMIITVTLNAAIDKTLAVPNFQIGRRHRSTEQRTMAGGKGVNVARALKTLGQPVIATGLAGGPTGTRIIEQLTGRGDPERLRPDRRRVAHVDGGDRSDLRRADRDQRARARGHRGGGVAVSATSSLYLAKGADICVFAGSLPRGRRRQALPDLIVELKRLGVMTVVDTEGEPMELALRAGPDLVSPNSAEAEELVGPRVPRRAGPRLRAVRALRARPARGDHHPRGGLLRARRPRPRARAVRAAHRAARAGVGDRRRGRLPGRLPRRALHRPRRTGTRCASRSPAAPSRRSTSAPACSTRARRERLEHEVVLTELDEPARGRRARLHRRASSRVPRKLGVRRCGRAAGSRRSVGNIGLSVGRRPSPLPSPPRL